MPKVNAQIPDDSKLPLLFLDINLGNGTLQRLVVYQGDEPEEVADAFVYEHSIFIYY